eukprot:RCo043937
MSKSAFAADDDPKVKVCSGHSRPVPHIAYSGIVDGSYWFVSSCLDGKPHLRNGETGDWVGTFEGHKGAVWMSCFNRAATHLVTASGDYSTKIWNALDGSELQTWPQPHCVKSADWSEAGGASRVVTGCMDKFVRIYDVARPDAEPIAIEAHSNPVKTAFFHITDLNTVYSAGTDNVVKKWDLRTPEQPVNTTEIADLTGMEYSRDCDILIVASKLAVTFLNTADISIVRQFPATEEIECAALSPSGEVYAVGSKLKVKEYDRASGTELQVHRGHHGPVFTVQYAPTSTAFASGSEDGMVRIWPTSRLLKQAKEQAA